ncbi:MAG TPA: hypothetical protein VKD46_06260 [bacterium]|nr:hypothetical protein [bacterium]
MRPRRTSITHRGPAEDGFYRRGPLGMGNRRLSNYPDLPPTIRKPGNRLRPLT